MCRYESIANGRYTLMHIMTTSTSYFAILSGTFESLCDIDRHLRSPL